MKRTWAVGLLMLCWLGFGGWSEAKQRGVRVLFAKIPKRLVRGKKVLLQGRVLARGAALRRGLALSFFLRQGRRRVPLLQRKALGDKGAFRVWVEIPRDISPRRCHLETVVWGPIVERATPDTKMGGRARRSRAGPGPKGRAPTSRKGKGKGASRGRAKGSTASKKGDTKGPASGKKGDTKGPASSKKGDTKDSTREARERVEREARERVEREAREREEREARERAAREKRNAKIFEQLRQGWGPAADKGKVSSLRKDARKEGPGSFLLPPVRSREKELSGKKPGERRGLLGSRGRPKGQRPAGAGSKPGSSPSLPGMRKSPGQKAQVKRAPGQAPGTKHAGSKGATGKGASRPGGAKATGKTGSTRTTVPGPGGVRGARTGRKTQTRPRLSDSDLDKARRDGRPLMLPRMPPHMRRRGSSHASQNRANKNRSRLLSQAAQGKLDGQTDGGDIYMRQVFEPYLPHHQRITVLDRVMSGYRLRLQNPRKRTIPVGGQRDDTHRNFFTGRIRVLLMPGRWTPIPSVAPDARVLWYRASPNVKLDFAKDGGDLMFVRGRTRRAQEVYLEFGTDGDKFYFGGSLPPGVWPRHYTERVGVPRMVRRVVMRNLKVMGLHPQMELREILRKLVPYLRSFVAKKLTPEQKQGDLYKTLLRARVGVCRHRAMIFTVTMRALGYPARFVANGAHAFAELQFPDRRWRVVDLGGGDIPNWEGKWRGKPFQPPKDPYPDPPSRKDPPKALKLPPAKANQPYIPNNGRKDNSTAVRLMPQTPGGANDAQKGSNAPGTPTPGTTKQTRVRLSKKPIKRKPGEFHSALKRMMKRHRERHHSRFVVHSRFR